MTEQVTPPYEDLGFGEYHYLDYDLEQPHLPLNVVADAWLDEFTLEIFRQELFTFWSGNRYAYQEKRPCSDSEHFQLWPSAQADGMNWYAIRKDGKTLGMIEVAQRRTDHVLVLVGTNNGEDFTFMPRVKAWLKNLKKKPLQRLARM